MLEIARPGSAEPPGRLSIRVSTTSSGFAAFALCETKMRPSVVLAHSVPLSAVERCTQLMRPPRRVPAENVGECVKSELSPYCAPPMVTQSPHCDAKSPVRSLQCWSR
jgi:hypothetical protein